MSDGERGIFYLVARVMLAAPGSTIVVDEPELHIHRSLRNRLWDQLEQARGDCAFIYFTHDVDFASSRRFTRRYAVKSSTALIWNA